MGSFFGHIDEGIFFTTISFWWMWKLYSSYLKNRATYSSSGYSFASNIRGKQIPLEAILKLAFLSAAALAEFCDGFEFVRNGHFRFLNHLQHLSIYIIFVVHSAIDLCSYYKITQIPKSFAYISGALAFCWYGTSFAYHAAMEGKPPLEKMIHNLPIPIIYALAAFTALEYWNPKFFAFGLGRIFSLMNLGTWFAHASFVLYDATSKFPGNDPNPKWDQHDHANVHFTVAVYGYYLSLNMIVMTAVYVAMAIYYRKKSPKWREEKEEMTYLIMEEGKEEV